MTDLEQMEEEQLGEGKKRVGIEWVGAGFSLKISKIAGKSKKFSVIWFCSFGLEMGLNESGQNTEINFHKMLYQMHPK